MTTPPSSAVYDQLMDRLIPEIPKSLKVRSVLREMTSFKDAFSMTGKNVAAHACFWAPCQETTIFGNYNATVMMQLRFDGTLGFFGGFVQHTDGDLIEGLTRELVEECNYSTLRQRPITPADYHSTRVTDSVILHFFVVQLTMQQLRDLEMNALNAKDYGKEVFGHVRVPLFTMENKYSGLPAFLNNKFIGSAKQQLLFALYSIGIFNDEQIDEIIYNTNNMKLSSNRM